MTEVVIYALIIYSKSETEDIPDMIILDAVEQVLGSESDEANDQGSPDDV